MSNVWQERTAYLNAWPGWSQTKIATVTGIPRATVGYVMRGERELPSKYWDVARSTYINEVGTRLISIGTSATNAASIAAHDPLDILSIQTRLQDLIHTYTGGQMYWRVRASGGIIDWSKFTDEYMDAYDEMRQSFIDSDKPLADIDKWYP